MGSCGQGVSEADSKMRTFLCIVLTAAAMADSEPYTIGQVAHGYAVESSLELTTAMAMSLVTEPLATVATLAMEDMLATVVSMVSTKSVKLTVILMLTPLARLLMDTPMVSSLELTTDMAVSLAMELSVTVAMLAMEDTLDTLASTLDTGVSMVATVATMASVRLTPMLTPSARSPTVSPRP